MLSLLMIFVFLMSATLFVYSYIFYPISLMILAKLFAKNLRVDKTYRPKVSVLIAAYNEERAIQKTILRLLESDYDMEKMEIIVGSDMSTDGTNAILESLAKEYKQVKFFPFTERRGKARIINDLFKMATGEILIFCDANTMYANDAIKKMTVQYADPDVGGVCGRLVLNQVEKAMRSGSKELNYWNYETEVKALEGRLGILIGSNGGIYSIRKSCFVPPMTNPLTADDLYTTMKVLEQKKKFLYLKDAIAEEDMAPSVDAEFHRKIRITATNISTIKPLSKLLSPSYGLVAYGFWFHKIVRWFSPFLMISAFVSNAFIIGESSLFYYAFLLQGAFYLIAVLGQLIKMVGIRIQPFLLCTYFVMANIALIMGIFQHFSHKKYLFWESTARD